MRNRALFPKNKIKNKNLQAFVADLVDIWILAFVNPQVTRLVMKGYPPVVTVTCSHLKETFGQYVREIDGIVIDVYSKNHYVARRYAEMYSTIS